MKAFHPGYLTDGIVRLVQPTDFDILDVMADGKRQTPESLGQILRMRNQYMSERLGHLRGSGLVERVENSTMHEITEKGEVALELRDEYSHENAEEFDAMIEAKLTD